MLVHDDWLLTWYRAAIHVPTATAVVADLHLGYSEVRRRTGEAVPLPSAEPALDLLRDLCKRHAIRRLVVAGDLYECGRTVGAEAALFACLRRAGVAFVGIIPGNHDRGIAYVNGEGVSLATNGVRVGQWQVVHGDGRLPLGRFIQGHIHPCMRWGSSMTAPCFLVGARRLIVPAFSADAAGVNVLRDSQWRRYRCAVIAGQEVLDFGWVGDLRRKRRTASVRKRGQDP